MELVIGNNKNMPYANHQKAQRFTMWLGIASMAMMFGAFTSAYIVRKGAGNWVEFGIPSIFYSSTLLIFLSSVTMHIAHVANKRSNKVFLKLGLFLTLVLGVAFSLAQYQGWYMLQNSGIYLDGNVSGSFFYVITYAHAAHVFGGILFLLTAFIRSFYLFRKNDLDTFYDHSKTQFRIRTDLLSMYWHFVGILWVYLFIFLSINHHN
jgi:cytochrome c oxidase subunit III